MVADVIRHSEEPSLIVLCATSGAYAESGRSEALGKERLGAPASKHVEEAIRRVRRDDFPKPGKLAANCKLDRMRPLAEVMDAVQVC